MKASTEYIIVNNRYTENIEATKVAGLLDVGYKLVISWVVGDSIHHILSKVDK